MNIELMEEIERWQKNRKRSGRSVKWLVSELRLAIWDEINQLKKAVDAEQDYRAYTIAVRLSPVLEFMPSHSMKDAIQTILKEGEHGDTGTDSAVGSKDKSEDRHV